MNLAQHLNRFYQDLKQPNANRYPVALVEEWLDEGERIINKLTRTIRASSVIDSVADQRLYSLPTGLLDWQMREVYYSSSDSTKRKRLTPISIERLDKIKRGWREDTGTPRYWYLDKEQSKWGLYPYPQTVQTGTNCIEILYRQLHTKMTVYYTTGTVSITNGATAVTGSGTAFVGNASEDDEIGIGKLLDRSTAFPTTWFAISEDPSVDTTLAIAEFTLATVSGESYIIASPSSIDNDELNLCSVLWAMSLAKGKDGDTSMRDRYQSEAMSRARHEMATLEDDAASEEPMIPEGAAPWPGVAQDDYQ